MDFNGIRLFTYPESPAFPTGQQSPMNWPIIKAYPKDEGTYRGKRNDNADVLLALSKVRLSPGEQPYLYVVTSAGIREVFKEARYLFERNIVLLLLAAALALFVSHVIGKKILLRDMDELISAARKLGEGDLSARAESGRGCREMRNLSETFNEMGQALENRQNELQETARSLSKMRNMLSNILESMPSAVIGLDRRNVITNWNQGAEHLSGTSAGSALGKPLHEVFPWLAGQVDNKDKIPCGATPLRLERCAFPEGNEIRFVDILAYPLVANGVEGAVVRVDDVTRRVELEAIMIQTEKISSMGCLAGGMAHEINNPLAGILQSIQNIQRRMSPGLEANIRAAEAVGTTLEAVVSYLQNREIPKFLDSIKQSGERAAKIVKNMLGFIRKSNSAHMPVHLPELVDRVIEIAATDYNLKKKYDFRRIEIIREYDPIMPPVCCSPSDIEQVAYNLLANAAQAMGSVDSPTEPPRLTLRIYQEGLFGVFEVEDNGPGMDEDVRKRVFEPLFTTKEPGEGTGLGLAVSYFIVVNSYGGSIQVESEKGKGSRFIIRLPLDPALAACKDYEP
jgi:PAS domain S-box-containing protein